MIDARTKQILKKLQKTNGISCRLVEEIRHANDSQRGFGYHLTKIRKTKKGYSVVSDFASTVDSKHNYTVRMDIIKTRDGYWHISPRDGE